MMSNKKPNTTEGSVFITCADSMPGFYCTRSCLASRKFEKVVVGVSDKSSELAKTLEKEGAIIKEWDLNNTNSIRHCLRDIEILCLVPEPRFDMVQKMKNVLEVAKNEDDLERIVMWSCVAASAHEERREDHKNVIRVYHELEQLMKKTTVEEWVICRIGVPMQVLFSVSEVIQNRGVIPLAIGNGKFAPVNIKDCGYATASLLANHKDVLTKEFNKQTLTFTGPHLVTGQQIADKANRALQTSLTFEDLSIEEMRALLEKEDELSSFEIEDILILMELIKKGKLDFTTDVLQTLLKKEPMTVEKFFQDNQNAFKPRGGRIANMVVLDY
ncbi:hypothetical protein RI367_002570 [Sorochytrium milnesiophthora]